ncbi:MAG: O-antigen ligase family protein [Deltaproteobacteria bacterium]|nr:O-antigen ligase family protein [Deltaproteobacteria bacterium]
MPSPNESSTFDLALVLLLGATALLILADDAVPWGVLVGKGVGGALLLASLPRLVTTHRSATRWLVLPVAGFAAWSLLSLAWTVDPTATTLRGQHLVMETLLLGAIAATWTTRGSRAVGLGGALATGLIAAGFLLELWAPDGARLRPFGLHPNLAARDALLGALLGTLLLPRQPVWGATLVGLVGGFAVGCSWSSGAILASVAVCAVLLSRRRWLPAVGGLVLGMAVGAAALTWTAEQAPPTPTEARKLRSPATALKGSAIEEIGSGRLVLWGHALRVARQSPLLGAGAGAFPAAMEPIRAAHQAAGGEHSKPRRRAHNTFLEVLAESGPLGLLLFVMPVAWAGRRAWGRRDEVTAALVTFVVVSALTDSLLQQKSLWLAVCVAVLSALAPLPRASEPPSPRPNR